MSVQQTLCRLDEIEDGGSKGLWPDMRGRALVFAVRQGDRVRAFINVCPHYGRTRLGWKKDEFLNAGGDKIICSAHGALFEVDNGKCTLGPCLGQSLEKLATIVQGGNVVANLADLPDRRPEIRS